MNNKSKFIILIISVLSFPLHSLSAQTDTNLILSEVMFRPAASNSEFIEIYNPLTNSPVDLSGFTIKYQTSSPDSIIELDNGTILNPGQFAVVLEGDYDFGAGIYKDIIPSSALLLKINNNAFGSSGMSNSGNRTIRLINLNRDTIAVYTYSANNGAGISDEKIILNKNNESTNWKNSFVQNGTPGFKNSVSPKELDVAVEDLEISPLSPIAGDTILVKAKIKNLGILPSDVFTVKIYYDLNLDGIGQDSELLKKESFNNLAAGDSIYVSTAVDNVKPGINKVIVKVSMNNDEDSTNNKFIKSFTVANSLINFNDVVINEIMYKPSREEPEWIELFNRSDSSINLKNWKLTDNTSLSLISKDNLILESKEYLVLSDNETISDFYQIPSQIHVLNLPSLNNSGDDIIIKDSVDRIIDSVKYLSVWGGNDGRSLERISAWQTSNEKANWKSSHSKFRATPGYINSVTQKEYDLAAEDIKFSPEFPFVNDTVAVFAVIKNIGKLAAVFSIELLEDTNRDSAFTRLIETSEDLTLPPGDSLLYNFEYTIQKIDNKKVFKILVSSGVDQDTSNNSFIKSIEPGLPPKSIVINEVMYDPVNGEPEWIELYNNTDKKINLSGWSIKDVFTTPVSKKINESAEILPGSFFVITKSLSILNYHRIIPAPLFELNFANLNNDVDGVVLVDDRGMTIDSMLYDNSENGHKGSSLERINSVESSTEFYNWKPSVDIELSTPGRINSVTFKNYDLTFSNIQTVPRFPLPNEEISISAIVKNDGLKNAGNFNVIFYYGTDYPNTTLEKINGLSLLPGDSLNVVTYNTFLIKDTIVIAAQITWQNDEDTLNNFLKKEVVSGYARRTILINEIMYNPKAGSPEWVECVNNSEQTVNLKDWQFSDLLAKPTKDLITFDDSFVDPGEYFIITTDTALISFPQKVKLFQSRFGKLGNTKDGVIIYDFRGAVIDSVKYNSAWGGSTGISLERLSLNSASNDSLNWSSSLDSTGSTPGKVNSIASAEAYNFNDLVINEIMYDPNKDNSEFVEFYNLSDKDIELGGWKFTNNSGLLLPLASGSKILKPKEYFLLAADSSVFNNYTWLNQSTNITIATKNSLALTNQSGFIKITDIYGNLIDSVFYKSGWNNRNILDTKNRSLERINPGINSNASDNWSTSVAQSGATPLKLNSIFAGNVSSNANLSFVPNPFSPDNDGFEDFCLINYNLTQPVAQIRIRVFNSKGRLVRTIKNNEASGAKGTIIFNGLDDNGNPLRIGIYIVLLEAVNNSSGILESLKGAVVVARKL